MEPDSTSESLSTCSQAINQGTALLKDAESFRKLMMDLQISMYLPVHQHKTRCLDRAFRYLNRALPIQADFHRESSTPPLKDPEAVTYVESLSVISAEPATSQGVK
jgi:hypothetical protein